jgi:hypothetical protein
VGRIRWIAFLVGAMALLALCAPGAALAGSYSWNEPQEFSGTAGTNPEQKYGQPSWSYDGGAPPALTPLAFNSGLSGWGGSSRSISASGGNLVMAASGGQSVTLAWTSPFGQAQGVAIGGSISIPLGAVCLSWSLTDSNGQTLASGLGIGGPLSSLDNLPPGGAVYLTLNGGLGCTADVSIGIAATTPPIALSSPSDNSVFLSGVPQFSGTASTAFEASNAVTVRVYSSSSGALVQTLTTTAGADGSFSVAPSGPLPNGVYSAVASQQDPLGQTNNSATVTFTLGIVAPPISLNSLGGAPLINSSPTFTGRAGTRVVDAHSVAVLIYSGATASGSPVQASTVAVNPDGSFSVPVPSPLADGRYTAIARQESFGTTGFSNPVTFRVKVHGPDMTFIYPASSGWNAGKFIKFSGQAGTALGDTSEIDVQLWRGKRAQGNVIGTLHVPVRAATWTGTWPVRLPYGKYTAIATQTDDAGHTTTTGAHTFSLVKTAPRTIGFPVSLNRARTATVPISCLAPASTTCTGTVLVVTKKKFRTKAGGPAGPLRVLFVYVSMPGSQTRLVMGSVSGAVASVLRRQRSVTVVVTASFTGGARRTATSDQRLNK